MEQEREQNKKNRKSKRFLWIKLVIAGILIVFVILIAILNYSGSWNQDKKYITSNSFSLTSFNESKYIYHLDAKKDISTTSIYFLIQSEENETHTIEIAIYTTAEFHLELDDENKPKLPSFETYSLKFSKTIDFTTSMNEEMTKEEMESEASKYKYNLEMNFNSDEIIVYIHLLDEFDIKSFTFIFE